MFIMGYPQMLAIILHTIYVYVVAHQPQLYVLCRVGYVFLYPTNPNSCGIQKHVGWLQKNIFKLNLMALRHARVRKVRGS
jgi:hypothetical protein